MNVYLTQLSAPQQAPSKPERLQKSLSRAVKSVLADHNLLDQFRAVSKPYESGSIAIVCSAEAATILEQSKEILRITGLQLDEGRTQRRQQAYANAVRYGL
ncbi:MAG: hypothetical protein ACK4NR_05055 [Micavibrio sp.]